jgi:hypothetical protein
MAGRGFGRGNVNMSQAELNALINARVVEALAAFQAGNLTSFHPSHTILF